MTSITNFPLSVHLLVTKNYLLNSSLCLCSVQRNIVAVVILVVQKIFSLF